VSLAIALFLVSSISSMVWVGPRVTKVMAEDYRLWYFLNRKNKRGIPVRAIWFQTVISLVMIWSGTFEQVLVYCGFILLLSGALAVMGTFFIDRRPGALPYRNPTHPWLPALFVLVSIWILSFLIFERPIESLFGLINIVLGLLTYAISKKIPEKMS
jgi:APA family basic amino acid/polyamine antiporter